MIFGKESGFIVPISSKLSTTEFKDNGEIYQRNIKVIRALKLVFSACLDEQVFQEL